MAEPLGDGAELQRTAWGGYSLVEPRRPATGLEVKLGSLALLLLITLVCGFLPLWIFRRPGASGGSSAARRKCLSLVSCFAGGVFLATCLLDLIPDYLAGMNKALEDLRVTLRFPLQEFILAMGFFLVLILEQIVLAYRDPLGSPEETEALLGTASRASPSAQEHGWPDGPPPRQPPAPLPREPPHVHVDLSAHSAVRSVALLLALASHAVSEGLAVGLQEEGGRALELCLALLVHKGAVAFSLGLKLLQGRLRPRAVAACLALFAAMSPLGIGLGVLLTERPAAALPRLSRCVLQGLATGTFVYVTFLEILPHELGPSGQRILKVIVLLVGFALVTGILFVKV